MTLSPRKLIRGFRERLKDRRQRFALMLYFGAFGIFLLFAIPAGLTVSSNPSFCAICHSMNPEVQTWKKSSHAAIPCYSCHGSRSYTQLLYGKAFVDIRGPFQELTGRFEKPVNEHSHVSQELIPMERCERCHKNENRKFTFSEGIYIDHIAHKKAGINCTVCHNRVVHKGAEEYEPLKTWDPDFKYPDYLTMKYGCHRCHSNSADTRDPETMAHIMNGKVPPRTCPTCHTQDFELPVRHERSDWRTQHQNFAKQDIEYCLSCHGESGPFSNGKEPWCTRCHDRKKVEEIIGRTWEGRNTDGVEPEDGSADSDHY